MRNHACPQPERLAFLLAIPGQVVNPGDTLFVVGIGEDRLDDMRLHCASCNRVDNDLLKSCRLQAVSFRRPSSRFFERLQPE